MDTGSVATAVIAIFGFGVAAWRWVIKPMRVLLQHMHEIITHELKPNGGTSLADRIERIEGKLDDHLADAEAHFREQHGRQRRYDPDRQEQPDDRN